MYLVTFRLEPGEYDEEFRELNGKIQAVAEGMDGYLGKRTWHASESDQVLVVYYWSSLDALEQFGLHADHKTAKQRWTDWYNAYEVIITDVLESYGSGFGDDTDPPA